MADFLVTGAAGFIASRVTEFLINEGHAVTGIDNLNDAYDIRMKNYRLTKLGKMAGFHFIRLDISDRDALFHDSFLENSKYEAVINLAARAGVRASLKNPWDFFDTNLTGTLNLLEYARLHGIKKFVQASTSTVYGLGAPTPTPEDADTNHPTQAYAASKKAAEVLCYSYHDLYDIDVSILRYFTVYGPAGRPDMSMFRFTKWLLEEEPLQLFGDGNQSRGFTYLDDIARGTIAALKPLGYEIFNLGGHEVISMNDLITLLESTTGRKARIQHLPHNPGELLTSLANVEKARKLLKWEPQVGLEEGVDYLVEWYQKERSWAKEVSTQ